jgi:hypothetical protein
MRPHRPLSASVLIAVLALGVVGTAAGGSYLALTQSAIAPFAVTDATPEQRVVAGSSTIAPVRAADPRPGQLPWTVRISRSETGLQCSTVGQVKDGTFGLVGQDGTFRPLPEANADACGEPGTLLGTRVFAAKRTRDVRTVVNGVAGADLETVKVTAAGSKPRTVPHTPDGAFAFVVSGYPEDAQPVVTLRRTGGATRTYSFGSGDGFVVADPYGGRAWKLSAFGVGIGRAKKPPRLVTACVNFATARAVPDEPSVSSPPVCGLEPGRRGVKLKPLYFDTRRLSGAGPSGNFLAGNWNHHPARVAVWGSARGHRRIVVRAGSFSQVTKPRLNAAFLVFLPPKTPIKTVTVEVDGKRYGPSSGTVDPPKGIG